MTIKRNNPQARLAASVEHGGLVYLSGQVPSDLNADVTAQAQDVLAKIDALLAEANSDHTRILSAQIWLKDMARDFAAFNAVWEAWMPLGHSPARAAVQAEMANPNILVEIMVTAVQK